MGQSIHVPEIYSTAIRGTIADAGGIVRAAARERKSSIGAATGGSRFRVNKVTKFQGAYNVVVFIITGLGRPGELANSTCVVTTKEIPRQICFRPIWSN